MVSLLASHVVLCFIIFNEANIGAAFTGFDVSLIAVSASLLTKHSGTSDKTAASGPPRRLRNQCEIDVDLVRDSDINRTNGFCCVTCGRGLHRIFSGPRNRIGLGYKSDR